LILINGGVKMGATVTIRLSDEEEKFVDIFKDKLGVAAGSKVFLHLLRNYTRLEINLNNTRDQLADNHSRLSKLERAINDKDLAKEKIRNIMANPIVLRN
jgi:hypothetical protein